MLAGVAFGVVTLGALVAFTSRPFLEGMAPYLFQSSATVISVWSGLPFIGIIGGLGFGLLFSLILIPVRHRRLAAVLLVVVVTMAGQSGSLESVLRFAIIGGIGAFVLMRFGVLAAVVHSYTNFAIRQFPLTTNWSAWYAQSALFILLTLVGLALYGFVTTVRRPSLNPAHT